MSGDYMRFPDTVEEFMDQYKVVDKEGIYMSKGAKLVPIFRMNQWFEHEKAQLSQEGITSDTISRQAAIDIIEAGRLTKLIDAETAVNGLRALPSAQPELAIKDCRNCKHGNYNDHWGTNFCYHSGDCNDWDKWEPSAQLERKRGCWVGIDDEPCDVYECDQCGTTYDTIDNTWDLPYFCPNCGADMRGKQE